MNKVVSSEIKYFHKEKTMNAEKWEKAEKVHSILLYPSVLQRKVKNGNKKNNNNRECSDGSVSHNNASYASFQAL